MASDLKSIFSSSGINFLFRIFGLATSFVVTIIISRLYGVDIFGNYSITFTVAQASAMVFALGIPNALIKISGTKNLEYKQTKKLLLTGLKTAAIVSLIPVAVFALSAPFIANNIFNNGELTAYFYIIAASLPFFVLHEIFLYFFVASRQFIRFNIFMFLLPNVLLILFLLLFNHFNFPEHYSLIAFAISVSVSVLVEALLVFDLKPSGGIAAVSARELIKTASPMMFSGLMLYLLNWTDVIMLGIMMDDVSVGIYNIAFKIGSAGFLVIVSVSTIVTPRMAELCGKEDWAGLKKLTNQSTWLIAALTLPAVIALIILGPYILSFFSKESVEGATALTIISLGVLFSASCGNVDQILNVSGHAVLFRNLTIICFMLNVLLNYWFINLYGINGSAAASLITNIVLNILSVMAIRKRLGFYTFA